MVVSVVSSIKERLTCYQNCIKNLFSLSYFYRDLTNGYLVAEIFSWYFPQDIQMHQYINGKSLESKQKNWDLLNNVSIY